MITTDISEANSSQEINIQDLIKFLKTYSKKIVVITILGLGIGIIACLIFGAYTATITLNNYNGLDIPRIRYLQSALPKLNQEYQEKNKQNINNLLSSESTWTKSIKPNILISKADGKELIDATALNAVGSKISSIQIISKSTSKVGAENQVQLFSDFFINGAAFIELRDLVRGYELKVISIDSNLKKKISSAEIELDYLQKRIKNLNELKNQYPNSNGAVGQILDAKDSGAKYLPISTQIVAATTDVNNLKEALARYKDEENQNVVYKLFVDKAKPLLNNLNDENNLATKLLEIAVQIESELSGNVQQVAIEEIKVSLAAIQTNRIYGLKQIGAIDIEKPSYLKYAAIGLFGGLIAGLLFAFGLKMHSQFKGESLAV